MFLAVLAKEMSNFGNSCKVSNFLLSWSRECENLACFVKTPTHGTFDVQISLAKDIIFTRVGV